MSTPIVMPWQKEHPSLPRHEVERMLEDIVAIATLLREAILVRGERDMESRLHVLHAAAEGLRDGCKVSLSVTAKKSR